MHIQDTKEQRQAFQAWCIQWNIASVFPLDDEGQYSDYNIHLLYCAWLQGQAAKAQAVPEGFVLVPKELSDEVADELASDAFNNAKSLFDSEYRGYSALQREHIRLRWCKRSAKQYQSDYKAMIEVQEQSHD